MGLQPDTVAIESSLPCAALRVSFLFTLKRRYSQREGDASPPLYIQVSALSVRVAKQFAVWSLITGQAATDCEPFACFGHTPKFYALTFKLQVHFYKTVTDKIPLLVMIIFVHVLLDP